MSYLQILPIFFLTISFTGVAQVPGTPGGAFFKNPPALEYSYVTTVTNAVAASSFTYTTASIGAADSNRLVVVGVAWESDTLESLNSLTIAGVSATKAVDYVTGTTSSNGCAFYYAKIPTGTTANIVLTFSSTVKASSISIFRLNRVISLVPEIISFNGHVSNATSVATTLNYPANGVSLFLASNSDQLADFPSWSGSTENSDVGAGSFRVSASHYTSSASEVAHPVTANYDRTVLRGLIVGASWR